MIRSQRERFLAVLTAFDEAVQRLTIALRAGSSTFAAVGESLVWICALDDVTESLAAVPSTYRTDRDNDVDGAHILGFRYARNQAVHGVTVLKQAELTHKFSSQPGWARPGWARRVRGQAGSGFP